MPVSTFSSLIPLLRCPACGGKVEARNNSLFCTTECSLQSSEPFINHGGQPVMVNFTDSIFDRKTYHNGTTPIAVPLGAKGRFLDRAREVLYGHNAAATRAASDLLQRFSGARARILVIGGGTEGSGCRALYDAPDLEIVGLDVFPSTMTSLVGDAHHLPFASASFDAVWIQAVLEHVLDPAQVVAEIHRVLKPSGLVYADTPFMQQVHAAAFDFQRFTASGHRWLFRRFSEIGSGYVGGPSVTLLWAIRYFLRGLGLPERYASILTLPFSWLRVFDVFMKRQAALDGACGIWFFGAKSEAMMTAREMIAYYERQKNLPVSPSPGLAEIIPAPVYASKTQPAGE